MIKNIIVKSEKIWYAFFIHLKSFHDRNSALYYKIKTLTALYPPLMHDLYWLEWKGRGGRGYNAANVLFLCDNTLDSLQFLN